MLKIILLILVSSCSHNRNYQGTISGYQFKDYKIKLSEGDRISLANKTTVNDILLISPTKTINLNQNNSIIDEDGEYKIRVLVPRALARKNRRYNYHFQLNVK